MTISPVISIITPVLNGEAFIGRAIRSVADAADMGADIEHIIVDGGSTDRTLDIVRDAQSVKGSPITKILTGPDSGQSQAINRGVAESAGSYVGWLNADDYYVPSGLADLAGLASQSKDEVLVGRCRFVDSAGRTVFLPVPPDPVTPGALLRLLSGWFAGRSIVQPEVFVRRETFRGAGGVDESLHFTMDHQLWLRLAIGGASFRLTDIDLARQLAHPGQKTADNAAVVNEILSYAVKMLQQISPSHERDIAQSELQRVATRVKAVKPIIDGLNRIGAAASSTLVSCCKSPRLSACDIQQIASRVSRNSRVLIAGLHPDDRDQLVRAFLLRTPAYITRAIPVLQSAFDTVVLSGSVAATLPDGFQVTDLLMPGGDAFLVGVSRGESLSRRVAELRKSLSDSVTFNTEVLLDTVAGACLSDRVHIAAKYIRGIRVSGVIQFVGQPIREPVVENQSPLGQGGLVLLKP